MGAHPDDQWLFKGILHDRPGFLVSGQRGQTLAVQAIDWATWRRPKKLLRQPPSCSLRSLAQQGSQAGELQSTGPCRGIV